MLKSTRHAVRSAFVASATAGAMATTAPEAVGFGAGSFAGSTHSALTRQVV
jgi:hypothetical protein